MHIYYNDGLCGLSVCCKYPNDSSTYIDFSIKDSFKGHAITQKSIVIRFEIKFNNRKSRENQQTPINKTTRKQWAWFALTIVKESCLLSIGYQLLSSAFVQKIKDFLITDNVKIIQVLYEFSQSLIFPIISYVLNNWSQKYVVCKQSDIISWQLFTLQIVYY